MQENNFEKEVRQKMEELQFTPSEPVWQKVELQIKHKRERRRMLLLLLPLLLVGGGLTLYFVTGKTEAPLAETTMQHPPVKETLSAEIQEQPGLNKEVNGNNKELKSGRSANPIQSSINQVAASKTQKENKTFLKKAPRGKQAEVAAEKEEEVISTLPKITKRENKSLPEDLHAFVLEQEIKRADAAQLQNENKNVSKPFWDSSKVEPAAAPIVQNEMNPADKKDSNAVVVKVVDNISDTTAIAAAKNIAVKGEKKNNKWSYTAQARIGTSGIRSQMLQVFSQERSADFSSSPNPNSPGSSSGNNNNVPGFSVPSEWSNGFAFSASAGLRYQLFKNSFVVAGLQYSQYSYRTTVGTQIVTDTTMLYNGRLSTVAGYYRSGNQHQYTSRFHYIELPLAFEYLLFKNVPLQIQHGVSAGYLIGSNALYYNRSAGILYPSDEWQRKWGLQLFTSLDYRLLQTGRLQWFAGPQLQWGLAPLQQKAASQQQHLFFFGLQTRTTF